jgi:hypothetical protein
VTDARPHHEPRNAFVDDQPLTQLLNFKGSKREKWFRRMRPAAEHAPVIRDLAHHRSLGCLPIGPLSHNLVEVGEVRHLYPR